MSEICSGRDARTDGRRVKIGKPRAGARRQAIGEGGEIHTGTLTDGKVKGAFHLVTLPRLRKEGEM